jgi:hypothetical protein
MDVREVLYFGILVNISAGLGAIAFTGSTTTSAKPTMISLAPTILLGTKNPAGTRQNGSCLGIVIGVFSVRRRRRAVIDGAAARRLCAQFFGLCPVGRAAFRAAAVGGVTYRRQPARRHGVILPFFILGAIFL